MPTRSFILLLAGVIVAAGATIAVAALAGLFADPASLAVVAVVALGVALVLRLVLSGGVPSGRH